METPEEPQPEDRGAPAGGARARARATWHLLLGAGRGFVAHNTFRMAGAVSFYTLFSLAPLITVVLAVAGFVVDEAVARQAFATQLGYLIGADSAQALLAVADASAEDRRGAVAGAIAVATTLVGATTVFAELKGSLDDIWDVERVPRKGWWELVRARLLSFGLVLAIGFLLLVSLFVSTVLATIGQQLHGWLGQIAFLAEAMNVLATIFVTTLLFAAIFKLLPEARLQWRDVWLGAGLTAVLFTIGKSAIGLYLGAQGLASVFGAAGAVVIAVVWVYFSSLILYFGAELTREFAIRHGTLRGTGGSRAPGAQATVPTT